MRLLSIRLFSILILLLSEYTTWIKLKSGFKMSIISLGYYWTFVNLTFSRPPPIFKITFKRGRSAGSFNLFYQKPVQHNNNKYNK